MHFRADFFSKIKKIKNTICQDNSQFLPFADAVTFFCSPALSRMLV